MSYHKVIGYFYAASKIDLFCDGDSLIVAGTEELLKDYIAKCKKDDFTRYAIKKARFGDIINGMNLGAAYSFDEVSYNRFFLLAQREGINISPQDFSKKTPTGINFVRLQIDSI